MRDFLSELKRRNVVRVGIAYVVFAWVVMQVIDVVVEPLHLPVWTATLVLVILLIGLPLALFLSWAYEITPEGVRKTHEVDRDKSITPSTGRKLDRLIMAVMALAIALLVYDRFRATGTGPETMVEPRTEVTGASAASIAVLPFADLSPGKDQDYFSDGISEELLNVLAQVPDLRVAARTSSFQFKGQNLDVSEVGRQLNVAHVLEGSVRKSGTRLRITAQLIDVESGFHLWSSTYDRELKDIFAVQDEISRAIVNALVERLGIHAPAATTPQQTVDTEAYEQYLLARQMISKRSTAGYEAAQPYLEQALAIAPTYGAAHAALAEVNFSLSSDVLGTLPPAESTALAEQHANRALTFDPNEARAYYVKGALASRRGNTEESLEFFQRSLAINPSQSDVLQAYSVALFDEMNRFEESIEVNAKAVAIDPLDHFARQDLIISLAWAGRFGEAEDHLRRLERLNPFRHAFSSHVVEIARGNIVEAVKIAIRARPLFEANNFNRMANLLADLGFEKEALDATLQRNAEFYTRLGDFEQALLLTEKRMAVSPEDDSLRSSAGILYAFTGRPAEAEAMLEPLWTARAGRITLSGTVNRSSALALMAARLARGDAAGAHEVYGQIRAFQELVDEAGVAPVPRSFVPAAIAMLLAGDEAEGFARLATISDSALYPVNLAFPALDPFAGDPRMVALKKAAAANRTRDRRAVLKWLCVPDPPTENFKFRPESCAAIGR